MRFAVLYLLMACAAPALSAQSLSQAERSEAVRSIAELIRSRYVFPERADRVADLLLSAIDDPRLASATGPDDLADRMTQLLRPHDGHFNVSWTTPRSHDGMENHGGQPSPNLPRAVWVRRNNYRFVAVERLPGNVGYLRLDGFEGFDRNATSTPPEREVAEAAMGLLARSDALVIDLRWNQGGSPAMVHLLMSYLLDESPRLLNRFRRRDSVSEYWTFDRLHGPRLADPPLFIVVGPSTLSAAEEFAYGLQAFDRATIVGAPTGGAANPGRTFMGEGGFGVFVPIGAAENPVTRGNWEGVGVVPDVPTAPEEALDVAIDVALEAILARISDEGLSREARWTLEWRRALREDRPVPASEAARFVGEYGRRTVTRDGDRLLYRVGEGPQRPLVRIGDDLFGFRDDHAVRVRLDLPDGRPRLSVLYDYGAVVEYLASPTSAPGSPDPH